MELKFDLQEGFQNYSFSAVELDNNTETHNISFFTGGFKTAYSLAGKKVRLALVDKHKRGNIVELQTQGDKAIFKITDIVTASDGEFFCQFNFSSSGFNQTSRYFKFVVKNNLLQEIAAPIVSSDLYKELREALDKVIEMENSLSVNLPKLESSLELAQGYEGFVGQVKTNTDNITKLKDEMLENINAMYVPYEGEYITAKNCYNGNVKDLVIKGKTMYKKADGVYTDTFVQGENYTLESVGQDDSKISLISTGKNLFDYGKHFYPRGLNTDGTWYKEDGVQYGIRKLMVAPNTTYVISGVGIDRNIIAFFDSTDSYISTINSRSFTTPSNCAYINAYVAQNSSLVKDVQIEKDSTSTPYEPYKEDRKQILLPSSMKGLAEWDYYRGSEIVQGSKELILKGTESFEHRQDLSSDTLMYFQAQNLMDAINGFGICNNFVYNNEASTPSEFFRVLNWQGNTLLGFKILKSKLSTQDVEGFKKWLQANPTTVIYKLATPTTHITTKQTLSTFKGTTHINSDEKVKPVISCKVPSNAPALISDLQKENIEHKSKLDRIQETQYNLINMLLASNLIDKEGWAVDRSNE